MKKIAFLSFVFLVIITGCKQQKTAKSPIEGVWQVVSAQQWHRDTLILQVKKDIDGTELKIWSGNYFTWIGKWKINDTIQDYFGGGTYKLEGNRYEESQIYPSQSTGKMLLEIRNDTITQIWPVDDNGNVIKSNYGIEKYVRNK
jgi:hypothetical protein